MREVFKERSRGSGIARDRENGEWVDGSTERERFVFIWRETEEAGRARDRENVYVRDGFF